MSARAQAASATRSWALTDSDLRRLGIRGEAFRMMTYARDRAALEHNLAPKIRNYDIERELGCDRRTVQRAKRRLEKLGLVQEERKAKGCRGPNGRNSLAMRFFLDRRQCQGLLPARPPKLELVVSAEAPPGGGVSADPIAHIEPSGESVASLSLSPEGPPGARGDPPPLESSVDALDSPAPPTVGAAPMPAASAELGPEPERTPPPPELCEPELSTLRRLFEAERSRLGTEVAGPAAIEALRAAAAPLERELRLAEHRAKLAGEPPSLADHWRLKLAQIALCAELGLGPGLTNRRGTVLGPASTEGGTV